MKVDVLDKGYIELLDHMGSDLRVVQAARVSYDRDVGGELTHGDIELLHKLADQGHTQPLRHCVMTFRVKAPLFVARQWFRYTVASTLREEQFAWNEQSRRYTTGNLEFYNPAETDIADSDKECRKKLNEMFFWRCWSARRVYQRSMEHCEIPAGTARALLPQALYTKWIWTASLQSMFHFLDERQCDDAQWEIRQYAKVLQNMVVSHYPETAKAWGIGG